MDIVTIDAFCFEKRNGDLNETKVSIMNYALIRFFWLKIWLAIKKGLPLPCFIGYLYLFG